MHQRIIDRKDKLRLKGCTTKRFVWGMSASSDLGEEPQEPQKIQEFKVGDGAGQRMEKNS